MIDRLTLITKLNGLCWAARRYGHDDYGLEWGVNAHGDNVNVDDHPDEDIFHAEAVDLADELLRLVGDDPSPAGLTGEGQRP